MLLQAFAENTATFTENLPTSMKEIKDFVQPIGFYKQQKDQILHLHHPANPNSPAWIEAVSILQNTEMAKSLLHRNTYFDYLMPILKQQVEFCKATTRDCIEELSPISVQLLWDYALEKLEISSLLIVVSTQSDPSKRLPTLEELEDLCKECKENFQITMQSMAKYTARATLHKNWIGCGTRCTVRMWPLFRAARCKLLEDQEKKLKTELPTGSGTTSSKGTPVSQISRALEELKVDIFTYSPVVSKGKEYLLLITHFQKLNDVAKQHKKPFDILSDQYSAIQEQFWKVKTEVTALSQEANDLEMQWLNALTVVISRDDEFLKESLCKAEIDLTSHTKKETRQLKQRMKLHSAKAEDYHKQLCKMVDHTYKTGYGETLKTFKDQKEHLMQMSSKKKALVQLAKLTHEELEAMKYPSSEEDEETDDLPVCT